MNQRSPNLILGGLALAGLTLGYFGGQRIFWESREVAGKPAAIVDSSRNEQPIPDFLFSQDPDKSRDQQDWIRQAGENDIQRALQQALTSSGSEKIITYLFQRWAQLNPRQAVENAQRLSDRGVESHVWKELLKHWMEMDFTAAKTWAQNRPPSRDNRKASAIVAKKWSETDPAAAVLLLDGLKLPQAEMGIYEEIFTQWAERDFAAASALALGDGNARTRRAKLQGLFAVVQRRAPLEALNWLKTTPDFKFRADNTKTVAQRWMSEAPADALEYVAVEMEGGSLRRELLESGGAALAKTSLFQAKEFFDTLNLSADRTSMLKVILQEWIKQDPAGALKFAQGLGNETEKSRALREAISIRANDDLEMAKAWLELLPEGHERQEAVLAIAKKDFWKDPAAALQYCLTQSPPGISNNSALQSLVAYWGLIQTDKALEWIQQYPEGKVRSEMVQYAVLHHIALRRGNFVEAFCRAEKFGAPTMAAVSGILASNWGEQNPQGAADWVSSNIAPGDARQNAYSSLASAWSFKDLPKAVTWLGQLKGSDYDSAARSIAPVLAASNPAGALDLTSQISNARTRSLVAEGILRTWKQTDSQAAITWMKANPQFDARVIGRLLPK